MTDLVDAITTNALTAQDIVVDYRLKRGGSFRAVDHVSIEIREGEVLGLVGESGCGKSSLGRSLVQLPPPTKGSVRLGDTELTTLSTRELRSVRRTLQLIFQDPISSLNPRRTAAAIVAEPLRVAREPHAHERALAALQEVGISEDMATRQPHELSGGQCQRVSIARAMVQEPEVLVCDEPVSALDVSVQAQVLNLLQTMRAEHALSVLFISHDLAVVNHISDRVAVMYLGRICEIASSSALYANPMHHYTNLLLASVPQPGSKRSRRSDLGAQPQSFDGLGCRFANRCPAATETCRTETPPLVERQPDHFVACHHPLATCTEVSTPIPASTAPA